MIATERTYAARLALLARSVASPAKADHLLSAEAHHTVFGQLDAVLNCAQTLVQRLDAAADAAADNDDEEASLHDAR